MKRMSTVTEFVVWVARQNDPPDDILLERDDPYFVDLEQRVHATKHLGDFNEYDLFVQR